MQNSHKPRMIAVSQLYFSGRQRILDYYENNREHAPGTGQSGGAAPYTPPVSPPSVPAAPVYPASGAVYSSQYNTDRAPYYGAQYAAQQSRQNKPRRKLSNGGLIALCIAFALVFSFIGTALGATVFSSASGTAPLIQNVDSGGSLVEPEPASYAGVVDATQDSVVEIKTQVPTSTVFGDSVQEGAGSGVIISPDGYILTNNHVISGSDTIQVVLSNGTTYNADVIGADSRTDVAVLKINATGLPAAVLGDSNSLQVGDRVIAIGNPLGSLGGTVTEGIISATDREIVVGGQTMTLLQTSAAVNPGNSGGGLFNMSGELVGIVNAKSSGTDVEGLGFAVPINTVKAILEDLMTSGYVTGRPEIGFSIYNINDAATAYQYGVSRYGVYIVDLVAGGPAEKAGLQVGDYIVSIDGTAVEDVSDVTAAIDASAPGDTITLQIIRGDRTLSFDVTLREKQPSA